MLNNPKPPFKQIIILPCPECSGTGKTWYSCCGDNMDDYPEHQDYMICPTCKEHLGEPEPCETCNGEGEVEG